MVRRLRTKHKYVPEQHESYISQAIAFIEEEGRTDSRSVAKQLGIFEVEVVELLLPDLREHGLLRVMDLPSSPELRRHFGSIRLGNPPVCKKRCVFEYNDNGNSSNQKEYTTPVDEATGLTLT